MLYLLLHISLVLLIAAHLLVLLLVVCLLLHGCLFGGLFGCGGACGCGCGCGCCCCSVTLCDCVLENKMVMLQCTWLAAICCSMHVQNCFIHQSSSIQIHRAVYYKHHSFSWELNLRTRHHSLYHSTASPLQPVHNDFSPLLQPSNGGATVCHLSLLKRTLRTLHCWG